VGLAAEILYLAAFVYRDIEGKDILDLGTGTGRLAIGAALLGAKRITGVDIDPAAIAVARENARRTNVGVDWIVGNLGTIRGRFDTVVMNPPFGTKRRHLDRVFLEKAISVAQVVYSIHKASTRRYILSYVERHGGRIHSVHECSLEIPRMFEHHTKRRYSVKVDCYRIQSGL
jgi:predicted RNA methylase